jgi:hypothetical protein
MLDEKHSVPQQGKSSAGSQLMSSFQSLSFSSPTTTTQNSAPDRAPFPSTGSFKMPQTEPRNVSQSEFLSSLQTQVPSSAPTTTQSNPSSQSDSVVASIEAPPSAPHTLVHNQATISRNVTATKAFEPFPSTQNSIPLVQRSFESLPPSSFPDGLDSKTKTNKKKKKGARVATHTEEDQESEIEFSVVTEANMDIATRKMFFPQSLSPNSLDAGFTIYEQIITNPDLQLSSYKSDMSLLESEKYVHVGESDVGLEQLGLFASKKIPKETCIAVFRGTFSDCKTVPVKSHVIFRNDRLFAIDGFGLSNQWKLVFFTTSSPNLNQATSPQPKQPCPPWESAFLINSSTRANAQFVWKAVNKPRTFTVPFVYSLRDIEAGEEIMINYRMEDTQSPKVLSFMITPWFFFALTFSLRLFFVLQGLKRRTERKKASPILSGSDTQSPKEKRSVCCSLTFPFTLTLMSWSRSAPIQFQTTICTDYRTIFQSRAI